jgi:hypothetical protein
MSGKFLTLAAATITLLASGAATGAAAGPAGGPAAAGYPNSRCLALVPPAYGAQVWTGTAGRGLRPADIIANWGSTTVNPATQGGPGTARNAADAATISAARKAGITVLGYIWSGYGAVTAAEMEVQVRQWRSWYGVTDVYLDGAPASAPVPRSYATVDAYVRAHAKGAQVWANPGALSVPQLMSVADVVQIFEGSYRSGQDNLLGIKIPAWVRRYPASRFAFTVYSTARAEMPKALSLIRADHGGHAYVTNGNPATGNPYSALPGYWRDEVSTAC